MAYFDKKLDEALAVQPATKPAPTKPAAPTPSKPSPWNPTRPKQVPEPKNQPTPQPQPAPSRPAPSRPVRTIPRPTKPSRPAPSRPSKPSPWNPTRPKQVPEPKNVARESMLELLACLIEDYESETHPTTQSFWGDVRQGQHKFAKHPILAMYGDELSRSSWEHTKDKARQSGVDMSQMMDVMMQITRLEQQHIPELIDLAKRITVEIWGIPEEMLEGNLGPDADVKQNIASDEEYGEPAEMSGDVGKQINKRITMNTLSQGSAVHAMLTIHHAVDREIRNIDPRLLELYSRLAAGAHEYYWLIDIPSLFSQLGMMAVGSANIEYPEDEDEEGTPRVVASAVCFPVLAQEMNKGVAELLSHHGLRDLSGPDTEEVLNKADDIRDEPYLIQVGPELWRRFLKVKPQEAPLADIMQALAMQEPDEVHDIIAAAIEDPERARTMLAELISDPRDFEADEWTEGGEGGEEERWDTGSGWAD